MTTKKITEFSVDSNIEAELPNQDQKNKRNLFYHHFRSKSNRNPIKFNDNKQIERVTTNETERVDRFMDKRRYDIFI